MLQVATFNISNQSVPILWSRRNRKETVWQLYHAADIIGKRLGTVLCQIIIVSIRTLRGCITMNVDATHFEVLIFLQGIDGTDNAIQLFRITTVIRMQLYAVYREIDISTLIQMADLDCLYLRTDEGCYWLATASDGKISTILQITTTAEVLMNFEIVVPYLGRQRNGCQILHGLLLLVVSLHHESLRRKLQLFLSNPSVKHDLLSSTIDNNLRHLEQLSLMLDNRSIHKLVVSREIQGIEIQIHHNRNQVIVMRHLYMRYLYLFSSQLETLAILGCKRHSHQKRAE